MNELDYFKTILTDNQVNQLEKNKAIIIKGEQEPTSKTTHARMLKEKRIYGF